MHELKSRPLPPPSSNIISNWVFYFVSMDTK